MKNHNRDRQRRKSPWAAQWGGHILEGGKLLLQCDRTLEFYYSPGNHIPHTERHELVPSAPMSISRFSSSLHTATFAMCYLPDNLVLKFRLPFLKKHSLVRVRMSEASLHKIIHSSCPTLECLVLVFTVRIGCLQIKSPNLVRIGISFDGGSSSSKMPLHFNGWSLILVIHCCK